MSSHGFKLYTEEGHPVKVFIKPDRVEIKINGAKYNSEIWKYVSLGQVYHNDFNAIQIAIDRGTAELDDFEKNAEETGALWEAK